jgi:hypothetical protein
LEDELNSKKQYLTNLNENLDSVEQNNITPELKNEITLVFFVIYFFGIRDSSLPIG